MSELGSYALLLALALSVYSFVAGVVALLFRNPAHEGLSQNKIRALQEDTSIAGILRQSSDRIAETARRAGIVVFFAVLAAAIVLVVAAFTNDFRIAYIFHHSNRDLDVKYKFATLWSGQEGSLVFWSLLLSGYAFVLRLRYKTDPRLFAYASVVLAGVQVFFLLLVNFAANPFGLLSGPLRADGTGL